MQEAEIRIAVPGQPKAKKFLRPHLKEKDWVWQCVSFISTMARSIK
jgi:hypothetical protein